MTQQLQTTVFGREYTLTQSGTVVSPVLNAFADGTSEALINAVIPLGEVLIGLGLILGALTQPRSLAHRSCSSSISEPKTGDAGWSTVI